MTVAAHGERPEEGSHAPAARIGPVAPGPGADVTPGGAGGGDLEQAIAVLRARVDEEFRVSERLDAKQRQAFALAAGFFALVQTVAFGGFAEGKITGTERPLLGALALFAGLLVARTAHKLTAGQALLAEDDIDPDAIVRWCNEADHDHYVAEHIISRLSVVAKNRAANNRQRQTKHDTVLDAAQLALIFAGAELIFAVIVRI